MYAYVSDGMEECDVRLNFQITQGQCCKALKIVLHPCLEIKEFNLSLLNLSTLSYISMNTLYDEILIIK